LNVFFHLTIVNYNCEEPT